MLVPFRDSSGEKYIWTNHARMKMRHYRLTESRIKRIIRHPGRVEEGIIENGIACMQRAESKSYSEIWTMYTVVKKQKGPVKFQASSSRQSYGLAFTAASAEEAASTASSKIKIITAWRYPGKSPTRNPVPPDILKEIKRLI